MFALPRTLLIFALCLPLAVLMGYMVSDPMAQSNLLVVGLCFLVLLMPLLLSFHHLALVWTASAYINAFFLPGQFKLWMLCAGVSFGISVLSYTLAKNKQKLLWASSVTWSLIALVIVALVTAKLTGGMGTTAMGSGVIGGKKYFWLLGAVIGYFAITMQPIPLDKVEKYMSGFCLAGCTAAFSNVAYLLGPSFYFLFLLFPVDFVVMQAGADYTPGGGLVRLGGLGPAAIALATFALMRWGILGTLDIKKPHRLIVLATALLFALLSGFRSILVLIVLIFLIQGFLDKLHKRKLGIALAVGFAASFLVLIAFANRLPLSAQRALSFLPINVDANARADARGSLEWRLDMWSVLWDQVPRYFWLGKGYAIDPSDLYFAEQAVKRGFAKSYDAALMATDYHSGPFSILIPFGIFGVLAAGWFLTASLIVLIKNYRHGPPELRQINSFLLAFFAAKTLFFIFIFGAFEVDIWTFASTVALGISINHGVRKKYVPPPLKVDLTERRERARAMSMAGV